MDHPLGENAMVTDEIDHQQPRLAFSRSQAAAELLQKDDLGLRRPQHDHAVNQWNVEPFVEHIDDAQRLQLAARSRCSDSL